MLLTVSIRVTPDAVLQTEDPQGVASQVEKIAADLAGGRLSEIGLRMEKVEDSNSLEWARLRAEYINVLNSLPVDVATAVQDFLKDKPDLTVIAEYDSPTSLLVSVDSKYPSISREIH
jgi:hypothetical protein